MMRPRSWLPNSFTKPKNLHSLEHLKYLHAVLCKHSTVTESNRSLLVESMRFISEILIWGDQNDSTVFDFFLEKNMLSFFLSYLQQRYGRYICVQILQTLNILFENISNETSLYYLLSNNHINSIIVHKFDFSDEEVMAYFISFLKTLSFKLNKHTIHFFYNEHTNDFALYTEAIKFFNHTESMVRIAVRTITLNVYKVGDKAMLRYIRDRTAAPYFFNLVWFIGVHVLDLDCCVRNDADHMRRDRLEDLVAEHLDHLHYLNDILSIDIDTLNDILTDHMLNRLFIPLYVYSLSKYNTVPVDTNERKHVLSVIALFFLSQVFLIIHHMPLVRQLADVIFHGDVDRTKFDHTDSFPRARVRAFTPPKETLAVSLESFSRRATASSPPTVSHAAAARALPLTDDPTLSQPATSSSDAKSSETVEDLASESENVTDEEKMSSMQLTTVELALANRPFLSAIFSALDCSDNDYDTLFSLCLLYALGNNEGINQGLMDTVSMPTDRSQTKENYNVVLVEKLIQIITTACQPGCRVRLVTLELTIRLLKQLVYKTGCSYLQDRHLAAVEHARETSTQLLRNFYKTEEIFLDMFEDEYNEMQTRPLNVEYLMMDASILLAPTGTPLTGIDFNKRLPCGDTERSRRAIRVFFMLRDLSLTLLNETETNLPLSKDVNSVQIDNVLDLNNSDLIACTVTTRDSRRPERRFLVIDCQQLILVEPDTKRLGWGVVRFVGLLQDVVVSGDKDDSRSLHATIHKPARSVHSHPDPLLSAKFIFDDHIRCMAAKQRLTKGRNKARGHKIQAVERLLDIYPGTASAVASAQYPSAGPSAGIPGRGHPVRARPSTSRDSAPIITRQLDSTVSHSNSSDSIPPSRQRDYVINTCTVTSHAPNLVTDKLDEQLLSACKTDDVKCGTGKNSGKTNDVGKEDENAAAVVTDRRLSHVESIVALNGKSSTVSDADLRPNSPWLRQDIQMKDFSRDRRLGKAGAVEPPSLAVKTRSHSHSPKRTPQLSPKERSKSTSATAAQFVFQKRETSSTASQTRKSLAAPPHKPSPKTLQPAEAPSISLLQQPVDDPSDVKPKLVPPIEVDRVQRVGEKGSSRSMKSQITELAQIVQRHYNYDQSEDK